MDINKLIAKHRIISEQIRADELLLILTELYSVLKQGVAGDVVEMGCYEGTSALFEARLMQMITPEKTLYLYDSFEGLPDKQEQDQSPLGTAFKEGELKASRARLEKNFIKAGLPLPEITRAWFYELDPEDLPNQVCFAFLDGDFYDSILDSLKLVWPRLQQNGVVIIDDYQNPKLPGAAVAVNEFFDDKAVTITAAKSLAIIRRVNQR